MSTTAMEKKNPQLEQPAVTIRLYNTLSREKEQLETVVPGKVGIYLCGPTVYKEAHIGHMVGPVIFDTIKRYLTYSGYDVTWVVNITDVDDKLIAESNRRGISMEQVATEMTADYIANLQALGVNQIDHMPKATDHIDEIVDFIQQLIDRGFAYQSEGDVYFEVEKDRQYGKLSNRTIGEMLGEGGDMAARKRAPGDFALWKNAKPGEPSWQSPWGEGRPGWHIECSAMSHKLLGETFDIHGGGLDLIFPHHENEIAQSECCHDKPMVRYWMHNGLMKASTQSGKVGGRGDRFADDAGDEGGKISRSKGAGGLADLIQQQGGERLRFFLLRTHYRSTIVFGQEPLAAARTALESFYRFFDRYHRITNDDYYLIKASTSRAKGEIENPSADALLEGVREIRDRFLSKMDDDFNTGGAVSELFELVRLINKFIDSHGLEDPNNRNPEKLQSLKTAATTLKELSGVLGLFVKPLETSKDDDDAVVGKLMELLIQLRADARKNKDFATADRIRDGLGKIGITIEDRKDGTGWKLN